MQFVLLKKQSSLFMQLLKWAASVAEFERSTGAAETSLLNPGMTGFILELAQNLLDCKTNHSPNPHSQQLNFEQFGVSFESTKSLILRSGISTGVDDLSLQKVAFQTLPLLFG